MCKNDYLDMKLLITFSLVFLSLLVIDDLISPGDPFNNKNDPTIPEKLTTKYHYCFLGIPLKVNYYILKKSVGLFVSTGISTDLFIDAKGVTKLEFQDRIENDVNTINITDLNKVNIVGLVGFGMDYKVTQRIKLPTRKMTIFDEWMF